MQLLSILPPSRVETMFLEEVGPGPILLNGLTMTSYFVNGVKFDIIVCWTSSSLIVCLESVSLPSLPYLM